MTPKNFYDLVKAMREAQRDYFITRSYAALTKAKQLERLIDSEIERVERIKNEPELEFQP